LGFLKQNSFVTDIQNWLGKEHTEEYSKYITYRYLKSTDLPFKDGSISFITCFQVLHHIKDKNYTLLELYRVLEKGGLILLREHNCEDIQDRMLIDLEHSLHAFVVDEQGQDYLQNYNDSYMTKLELEKLMNSFGFFKVDIKFPTDKGITKYYYSLWNKTQKKSIKKPMFEKNWADYSSDED
jgi:ubiquinone/menaquinone biosynthesis C-methylase UbiE